MSEKNVRILILSHTGSKSNFKIGSHHYANNLAELGCEVYYSGISNSLAHKILNKKDVGSSKIDKLVVDLNIKTLLPLTIKQCKFNSFLNKKTLRILNSKSVVLDLEFDFIICDYPYFISILNLLKYDKLIYRPTDDYFEMKGESVVPYEKDICSISDKIICTSSIVKEGIIERYSPQESKLNVIENGYDSELFKVLNFNHRSGCVYVGALDERFDFEALDYLSNKSPDIDFDIYGPISDELARKIEKYPKNVKFKGTLEYNDVPKVLNEYKVGLLLLNTNKGNKGRSPMKLWEYASCGLTVLYTNISHLKESEIFIKCKSKQELCEKVKILNDSDNVLFKDVSMLKEMTWNYKTRILVNIIDLNSLVNFKKEN